MTWDWLFWIFGLHWFPLLISYWLCLVLVGFVPVWVAVWCYFACCVLFWMQLVCYSVVCVGWLAVIVALGCSGCDLWVFVVLI